MAKRKSRMAMRVNLVNYEIGYGINGILSKFALKMKQELDSLGIVCEITSEPVEHFDIYHHINYLPYQHVIWGKNTLMITHINLEEKLQSLKTSMVKADKGICMSPQMQAWLVKKGLPRNKLKYILPANDKKLPRIPVAILTNTYPDGCKREEMLLELAKVIDTKRFLFRIMGKRWDISTLEAAGLQIEYYPEFNQDIEDKILRDSKYYLYFGLDEGSMGLLDAKSAGLKIISPKVGFAIDAGVDFPFTKQFQLNKIFLNLQKDPLEDWTWENYIDEHIKLWKSL